MYMDIALTDITIYPVWVNLFNKTQYMYTVTVLNKKHTTVFSFL